MRGAKAGEGGLSRLITWKGSDTSQLPALFISHVDVVPVQPENVAVWTHHPFSGALADGYVSIPCRTECGCQ